MFLSFDEYWEMKIRMAFFSAVIIYFAATPTWAQGSARSNDRPPNSPVVTFEEAVARALNASPELRGAKETIRATAGGARSSPRPSKSQFTIGGGEFRRIGSV